MTPKERKDSQAGVIDYFTWVNPGFLVTELKADATKDEPRLEPKRSATRRANDS